MRCLITSLYQTNPWVIAKPAVRLLSRIQGSTSMDGSRLAVPTSVLNKGTSTLRDINTCREGDATVTREFLENVHGLVKELTLFSGSNPPSEVEVSVGEVAWHPTLLREGLTVRLNRFGITSKITEALGALVVD